MSFSISPKIKGIKNISVTTGGNLTIESGTFTLGSGVPTDEYVLYRFSGTQTLSSDLDIVINGTPKTNTVLTILWEASVTLSGNDITLFGDTVPAGFENINWYAICTYNGSSWKNYIIPTFLASSIIGSSHLKDDSVITDKILDANVTLEKVENLTSTYVVVGNASNRPTAVAVTGDISITNAGVTSIGALKVLNAMINDLDASKLTGTLAAARIADGSLPSSKLSDNGLLDSKYSDTGTTAVTTLETLYTYTLPASTISSNGEGVYISVYGTFAANTNVKTIAIDINGNVYSTNAVTTAPNGTDFKAVVEVLRTGATSAVGFGEMITGAVNQGISKSKAGITWGSDTVISFLAQNGTAAANDIILSQVIVKHIR